MIGKIQDVVTAAVVIAATDNSNGTSSSGSALSADTLNSVQDSTNGQEVQNQKTQNADTQNSQQKDAKQDGKKDKMDEKSVNNMTKELNKLMSQINCNLEFQYHKEVNVMSVKMIDRSTKEVLREYPPEDMIKGMIRAKEWIGAFLDKNA